jgi:hypothetical protein
MRIHDQILVAALAGLVLGIVGALLRA